MGTIKTILISSLFVWLAGCATPGTPSGAGGVVYESTGEPMRYLAWLQGDLQSVYQLDRKKTAERLRVVEGKHPKMDDRDLYLEYCSLLDASGRKKEADAKLRAYLVKYPKETRAQFLLASFYLKRKKVEIALHLFRKLDKQAGFAWKSLLYNNLGMVALNDRNRREAIRYFQKAIKANPPIAAPLVNLGSIYLQSLSYADAERVFYKATQIDKDFEDAFVGWGVALEGLGRFKAAHRAYDDYLSGHSRAMTVLYNDAILLGKRLNRRADASQLLLRYVQRGGKATAKAQELMRKWR